MSVSRAERRPFSWKGLGKDLWRVAWPAMVPCIAFVLASPYIYSGLIVLYLRSLLVALNGFWAYASILLFVAIAIPGVFLFFRTAIRSRRAGREWVRGSSAMWFFVAAYISGHLIIPPVVALIVWSGMQTPDATYNHGRVTNATQREQLVSRLRALEKRGLWTWIERGLKSAPPL